MCVGFWAASVAAGGRGMTGMLLWAVQGAGKDGLPFAMCRLFEVREVLLI